MAFDYKDDKSPLLRMCFIGLVLLGFYGIIVYRLWDEQIRRGDKHLQSIKKQSIRLVRIPAVRGRIFTADKHLLVDNIPSYDVVMHLAEMRKPGHVKHTINHIYDAYQKIGRLIKRECAISKEDIAVHRRYRKWKPLTVFKDLSNRELSALAELTPPIPGTEIVANPVRFYPEGSTACHLIGYVGLDDPRKADDKNEFDYYIPDLVGRRGLEKKYDGFMKANDKDIRGLVGKAGQSMIRINNLGFIHEQVEEPTLPISGNDIILTLDWKAQQTAERLLKTMLNSEQTGALVLLDADDGAILAMASHPGYDLQDFVPRLSSRTWKQLNDHPGKPLLNRACMGQYTPGSIMKPLVALSLLENGTDPTLTSDCQGKAYVAKKGIRCWFWRAGGHGHINLIDSLKQSCNVYYIERGIDLGMEPITDMMRSAGFGQGTGFPLGERKGLIPTRDDKKRLYGTSWNSYDTALLSIGQGIILITPLQAAVYTAALANGGTVWQPYLLKDVANQKGEVLYKTKPVKTGRIKASANNIDIIKEGMWRVINATDGTAKKARSRYIELYGKTGTAEVGAGRKRYKNTWFIAFGEYRTKRYAIAVLVERGQSGGRSAAPIVGRFFDEWLTEK